VNEYLGPLDVHDAAQEVHFFLFLPRILKQTAWICTLEMLRTGKREHNANNFCVLYLETSPQATSDTLSVYLFKWFLGTVNI
jgi:hypothetical protein